MRCSLKFSPLVQTPYKSLIKDKNWEPKKNWSVALRLSLMVEWTENSSGYHLPSCQFTFMYVYMSACLQKLSSTLGGAGWGRALCSRHSMSPVLPITKMRVWCYVGSLERLISLHNNRDQQGRISSAARGPQGINRAGGTTGDQNIQDF